MSDTTKLRIGIQGARELEIEVEDAEATRKAIEATLEAGSALVWVIDSRGHVYGLVADKLAFVQLENATDRVGLGFAG